MKFKINIMSEAVTMPSLMMMTFRGIDCKGHTQTDRQIDRLWPRLSLTTIKLSDLRKEIKYKINKTFKDENDVGIKKPVKTKQVQTTTQRKERGIDVYINHTKTYTERCTHNEADSHWQRRRHRQTNMHQAACVCRQAGRQAGRQAEEVYSDAHVLRGTGTCTLHMHDHPLRVCMSYVGHPGYIAESQTTGNSLHAGRV